MNTINPNDFDLITRINPKFRPVWECLPAHEQIALARYFLPQTSSKAIIEPTRPKVIKWYCPFAAQSIFPSGHRYCINTYVGCCHNCVYCYACGYMADRVAHKEGFERLVDKDISDLERFDVPSAPVHLSNSTDPFQEGMESRFRHTEYALRQILVRRHRFTTVTILTKNPSFAVRNGYVALFKELNILPDKHPKHHDFEKGQLPGFQIEVSLAFWREEARMFYDPCAPSVEDRKAAIVAFRSSGVPVVLRIDPLFPRSPIPGEKSLADFGLPEAQTLDDLHELVAFAKQVGARHVVYSPVKLVQPRMRKMNPAIIQMKEVYRAMSLPGKPVWHGGSFRLPKDIADREIVQPFLRICDEVGMKAKFCMTNLIETP
jgi:DNA repair photolyase